MKKAFLVISPENSGNHILEHILSCMGCFGGRKSVKYQSGYPIRIISEEKMTKKTLREREVMLKFFSGKLTIEFEDETPLMYMRSLPDRDHHSEDVNPIAIKKRFKEIGYDMTTLIPVRDQIATILGNYREDTIEERIECLQEAWIQLGGMLKDLKPFYFINTSVLFKNIDLVVKEIEYFTGLKLKDPLNIWDADKSRIEWFLNKGLIVPER